MKEIKSKCEPCIDGKHQFCWEGDLMLHCGCSCRFEPETPQEELLKKGAKDFAERFTGVIENLSDTPKHTEESWKLII